MRDRKEYNKRYYQEKGYQAQKKYNDSEKGKQSRKRYFASEKGKQSRKHQNEIRKQTKLRSNYGITLEMVKRLAENGCHICGRITHDDGERLHVDHDHRTGQVRGVLCRSCNTGLGMFRDDVLLLILAVQYLEGPQDDHRDTRD